MTGLLLDNFRVTPGDVATDYKRSERLGEYQDFVGMRDSGANRGQLVERFGRDLVKSWEMGSVPQVVTGIIQLHKMGIFRATRGTSGETCEDRVGYGEILPFDHLNPKIRPLNILSALSFLRGSLSCRTQTSSKNLALNSRYVDETILKLLEYIEGREFKRPFKRLVNMSSPLAKLMVALDSPVGSNALTEVAVPGMVSTASQILDRGQGEDQEYSSSEVDLTRDMVRDWVLTFFYLGKGVDSRAHNKICDYSANLPESRDEEVSWQRYSDFIRIIEQSRLSVGTVCPKFCSRDYTGPESGDYTAYYAEVIFKDLKTADVERMKAEFRKRVNGMVLV